MMRFIPGLTLCLVLAVILSVSTAANKQMQKRGNHKEDQLKSLPKDQLPSLPDDQLKVKAVVESLPLVCYQVQRDELRQLFVDWLRRLAKVKSKSYQDMALDFFQTCDLDRNNRLDADELLKCTEKKKESAKSTDTTAHVLRGLCVDALVNLGDHDGNWALDFREFLHLLHPQFTPRAKQCSLEDKKYSDGVRTVVECNTCVCACGDWVCTGVPCTHQSADGAIPGPVQQGSLPSLQQREQLLSGFKASEVVLVRAVQDEVAHIQSGDDILHELNNLQSETSHTQGDESP
ncbi:follistatin-related protein 1-like isoform X2 [Gigantopelta aegis]|uniref:follistatin-related protein 1-like isoform X2 n=1 Tax=Gigantopelta aegis TaxID=1735272 RepID=UPI001B8890B6|nr:follistatin-related protein 1-like isoform X2 [Gigantopelta aegis]